MEDEAYRRLSQSDDSIGGESEKAQLQGLISSIPCDRQRCYPRLLYMVFLLVFSNAALFAALVKTYQDRPKPIRHESILPEMEKLEVFEYQPIYSDPPTVESEKAWKNMLPVGKGFVSIPGDVQLPDQPGLNKSLPEQHAIVAVFHQLHCLYAIREGYFGLLAGDTEKVPVGHMGHCWDYIRQSVMCNADTTLEWVLPPPDDRKGSTGWGYQHTCKDFGAIYTWAETNRWMTSTGIH